MDLTEDSFRALARSSPWRWRTLHVTRTGGRSGRVEAWIRRPGEMVTEDDRGTRVDRETDPMYDNYTWVAMLDPVELSAGTALDDLVAGDRAGRATWWATAAAEEEYEPRCGCCPLLWGEVSERHEAADGGPTYAEGHPDAVYPDAWRVALDVRTGVVVSLAAMGYDGDRTDLGFELELHAVDTDLDAAFTPRRRDRFLRSASRGSARAPGPRRPGRASPS